MQITLSFATTADGYLDDNSPRRLMISTPEDWEAVLRLRASHGAILAGAETLRRDDPDEERINRPDDPNNYWRYRMHLTIEELLASAEFNRSIKRMLRTSDRTDKP